MVSWMYRDLRVQAVKGDVIVVGLRSAKNIGCSSSTEYKSTALQIDENTGSFSLLSH